jgi:hypothetical protein
VETNQRFTFYRGYAQEIRFTLTDPDGLALTPTSLQWELIAWSPTTRTPGSTHITKTLAAGGIVLSDAGIYDVLLLEVDTADLTPATYYHELKGIVGGKGYILANGFATLLDAGIPD